MSSPLRAYDEANRLIKNIKIDSDGHLQVDVLSGGGGGGDASAANQATMITELGAIKTSVAGTLTVDGSGSTQPVSGSVAVSGVGGTVAVSASALPLPTGAATEMSLQAVSGDTSSLAGCVSGTALQVDIQADAVSLANQTKQDEIKAAVEDNAPSHVQTTLYSSSLVTSGAVSSEIDMARTASSYNFWKIVTILQLLHLSCSKVVGWCRIHRRNAFQQPGPHKL